MQEALGCGSLNLLDDARLELHLAETVNLAVDVMVANTINEADVAHLRSDLDRRGAALDLEVLDDAHRVAIGERRAERILDHCGVLFCFGSGIRFARRPLVAAHGAYQQRAHFVGEVA